MAGAGRPPASRHIPRIRDFMADLDFETTPRGFKEMRNGVMGEVEYTPSNSWIDNNPLALDRLWDYKTANAVLEILNAHRNRLKMTPLSRRKEIVIFDHLVQNLFESIQRTALLSRRTEEEVIGDVSVACSLEPMVIEEIARRRKVPKRVADRVSQAVTGVCNVDPKRPVQPLRIETPNTRFGKPLSGGIYLRPLLTWLANDH